MRKSFTKLFLYATVCLLILAALAVGLFYKKKAPEAVDDGYFKKLMIEKPGKAIRAPDFSLEDLSGRRLSLKQLRGKVVFLNFWATWCIPCREEMPKMEKLYREFREQGLEVVAINYREDKKVVRKFFDELGLTFTVLLDGDGKVSDDYGTWSLPLSYLIDRKGEFIGKVTGDRKWDSSESRAFFRDLLQEKN